MVHWELLITALNKQTFKNWATESSRFLRWDTALKARWVTSPKRNRFPFRQLGMLQLKTARRRPLVLPLENGFRQPTHNESLLRLQEINPERSRLVSYAAPKIFPGFNMPLGSRLALMRCMISISSAVRVIER